MRLVRYRGSGSAGPVSLGLADGDLIRPLASASFEAALEAMAAGDIPAAAGDGASAADQVQLLAPVGPAPKVLCIGLNYRDHAVEIGIPPPTTPVVFSKFPSSLIGPDASVLVPPVAEQIDWEAELAVVIGREASDVTEGRALDYVAGYANFNDVSSRALQFDGGGQWTLGKALDTFAPIGPAMVGKDEIPNPQVLDIHCAVDGDTVQDSNTAQMIFGVAELIAYLSARLTLLPGDIIATGTPAGVGMASQPPRYLRDGERVAVTIAGLGTLTNQIRWRSAATTPGPSRSAPLPQH